MNSLPWRFLVLVDAGVDSPRPARLGSGGVDGWLAELGASVEVPGGRHSLPSREAFSPAALRQRGLEGPALDAVLHAPAFQRLESAWRGLELLLAHAGDAIEIEVVSLPRKAMAARFRELVFEPETERSDPPSLIVADLDFTHRAEDIALLGELAGMAKVLQAPLLAHASAGFFDLRYLVQVMGLPDLLARLAGPSHAVWRTFQASEEARWTALTINRWLQRAPYGAAEGHAETVSESNPDSYLWGRGVWLLAAAVARSVRRHGHALDLAGASGGLFENLPTRNFPVGANTAAALAAEATISEMQVLELSRAAFTPIVGPLRRDVALIPIAVTTSRLAPGKLTLEGTLAYQITAARLAQFCGRMLDELPAGAHEGTEFVRAGLLEHLGELAGPSPQDAIQVEAREEKGEAGPVPVAGVRIKPAITLEGKTPEFEFVLPLRG